MVVVTPHVCKRRPFPLHVSPLQLPEQQSDGIVQLTLLPPHDGGGGATAIKVEKEQVLLDACIRGKGYLLMT